MRVRATKLGFDGLQRRHPGVEFEIADELFSKKWMESLEPEPEPKPEPAPKAEPAPEKEEEKPKESGAF